MRILIFADSHRKTDIMLKIIEEQKSITDLFIHLGDNVCDADEIRNYFPFVPLLNISGNCDFDVFGVQSEKIITLCGKKLYMTHGHDKNVKLSLMPLVAAAKKNHCNAALFAHTHVPYNDCTDGILLFNPGSISLPRTSDCKKSYGEIILTENSLEGRIIKI